MFKSIESEYMWIHPLDADNRITYYKLIDDDFTDTIRVCKGDGWSWGARDLIYIYKSKGLDVVHNLFLFYLFIENEYKWNIDDMLEKHNENLDKYNREAPVNFSEKYYQKLKDKWNRHKLFI